MAEATPTYVDKYNPERIVITHAWDQLTAAGATDHIDVSPVIHHTLQYKVANKNTSVTVRAEGSLDGTNFFNLDSSNSDTTKTANGTYAFVFEGAITYIRFTFVSEEGGSAATIDVRYFGRG